MRIWVSALACVPFVIKHILLQTFCQYQHKLYRDFGFSGCKSKGCCMILEEVQKWAVAKYEQNKGRKMFVPGLLENEAKNYQLLVSHSILVSLFMTENTHTGCFKKSFTN